MIAHKNFESNCKRIAKAIKKEVYNNPTSDSNLFGSCTFDVSAKLMEDVTNVGERQYINGINKELKNIELEQIDKHLGFGRSGYSITFHLQIED